MTFKFKKTKVLPPHGLITLNQARYSPETQASHVLLQEGVQLRAESPTGLEQHFKLLPVGKYKGAAKARHDVACSLPREGPTALRVL